MLTSTYVDTKSFSYPIGSTPAGDLLRDLRPGEEPVEILTLGCGDVRNILFTLWSQQHNTCKLNFTACDLDPAVLARNVFLLTAITQHPSSEEIERLWRTYYHFHITSTDLAFVQKHCNKLLGVSESISTWNSSRFGSFLKFSSESCLAEVRRMWSLYVQTRAKQEDVGIKRAIKSMHEHNVTRDGEKSLVIHGVRSAGAHGTSAASSMNETYHNFWESGVVAGNDQDLAMLNRDDGGRTNPLMVVSSLGSFNVHYDLDPLMSFHLAEAFDLPQTTEQIRDSLVHLAKSQFSGWCREFASSVASSSVNIMHHCGDAVNFSHALQAIQGSAILASFTYFYTKPWSSVSLDLPSDMTTTFDVIDTSNVMDHVGLLNLLSAIMPLLSRRRSSVLYTESLLQGAKESEKLLETLLHSNVTMSSLLFGVAPVGHLLGTMTDSTHVERLLDLSIRSARGCQKHYRMRIPWKRASHGDDTVPTVESSPYRLNMDPYELASLFMQTYLAMFRESEDLTIMKQVTERKWAHPLVGDLGFYSRLSLVALVASAKHHISTDWLECVDALLRLIKSDKSLMVGSNSLQELYMHLHLSGLWHAPMLGGDPREQKSYYGGPRPAGELGLLGQQSLPSTVHVALVVPRSKLNVFKDRHHDRFENPGLHLSMRTRAIDNCFYAIDAFFGQFKSDAIDAAEVVEDASGWSGTSDMIVTCRVPTWGLLVGRRQDFHVELAVNMGPAGHSYVSDLGIRMTVFSATLDSKDVRILAQAPCTKPRPVIDIEHPSITEPTGPTSATVSLNCDGTVASIGVTENFAPDSDMGSALMNGDTVKVLQISPCVLTVSIGDQKNTSKFIFPFPIDGVACKMRIARKSSWIEVRAPTSNALQFGGFKLDPFPVINQDTSPLAWSIGRVDPDLQPLVKLSVPDPMFLGLVCCMPLSKGDLAQVRANLGPGSVPPMIQLKEVIAQLFSTFAKSHMNAPDGPVRMLIIRHSEAHQIHIVAKGLRHDRDTGSIFLDGFFIPVTAEFDKHMAVSRTKQKCIGMDASKEDIKLWQHLLPALVERCRSWEHTPDCKYKINSVNSSLCDCGLGRDAEQMPSGYEDVARFATRIALPLISAVPYVESVVDEKMVSQMAAHVATLDLDQKEETSNLAVCDHCGSDKLSLKACSRCEKVKYCNHACQKAAWKTHKKVCKR